MNDDAQRIDQALKGDSEAFGDLVRKYQNRLYKTFVYVTGCCEEAEDVTQEAFVRAFVKLDSFRRDSAFYTWLYRIAFNIAISRRRKKKEEISLDQNRESTGSEPLDNSAEAPDQRLLREERVAQLYSAMASLSEEHRAILILREIEDFDYGAISEILELPIGTVRSRLHRARLQLHLQLTNMFHEKSPSITTPMPPNNPSNLPSDK